MPFDTITAQREPPCDLETEQTLLGECLAKPENFTAVAGILEPEHFADGVHQCIFAIARDMAAEHFAINASVIAACLAEQRFMPPPEARECVGALLANALTVMTPDALAYSARYIAELYRKRRLIGISEELSDSVHSTRQPLAEQVQWLESQLAELDPQGPDAAKSWAGGIDDILATYEQAYMNGGAIQGLPTGFPSMDDTLGGLGASNLYILAGRPGSGKSSLATNIVFNTAAQGKSVAMFSLEMPQSQVTGRIVCAAANVPAHDASRGKLDPAAFERLAQARDQMASLKIAIDDREAVTPAYIRSQCQKIQRKQGLDLIVIDYLQLMRSDRESKYSNRTQEITEISAAVKGIAKALAVPVLALAQINRGVESRDDKRPLLSDLRDSGSIEQDADAVIFIYREEYYLRRSQPDEASAEYDDWLAAMEAAKGKADVDIAKNRHGPEGRIQMHFNAPLMLFRE